MCCTHHIDTELQLLRNHTSFRIHTYPTMCLETCREEIHHSCFVNHNLPLTIHTREVLYFSCTFSLRQLRHKTTNKLMSLITFKKPGSLLTKLIASNQLYIANCSTANSNQINHLLGASLCSVSTILHRVYCHCAAS